MSLISNTEKFETKMVDKIDEQKLKRKRLGWSEGGELAFLNLWEDRVEQLRGLRKNGHVYAEMADELAKLGYTHSTRDVQVKLQNFTQRYRKEKAAMGTSGQPSTWVHYGRVHQIIRGIKANLYAEYKHQLESIDDFSTAPNATSIAVPLPRTPLPSPTSPQQNSPSPAASMSATSQSPAPSTSAAALNAGKRKRIEVELLKKFDSLSTDITEHLRKNEQYERELLAIERRKAETLERVAKDNSEVKDALLAFLNRKL